MDAPVNAPPDHSDAPAELVVVNGRSSGARRPLTEPLTLIGRAPGCEVRLNVEAVQPLHAALVQGLDGFLLRNLAGQGVLVNGEPATTCTLNHDDVIAVGPFQFRFQWTAPSAKKAAETERDALRVQAAAVAAQQAALNEEETRLRQRRAALEKQEEQLARHLEDRRRRLLELQEETRLEREAFQASRAATTKELAAQRKEVEAEHDVATALGKEVEEERRRLADLGKRLQLRFRRNCQAQVAALAGREKECKVREGRLQQEAEKLRRERAALVEDRLRLNGEVELNKRQMREHCQELGLAQQQWEACLNQEGAEREKSVRDLDARAAALEEAQRLWDGRERSVRLMAADLHRESTGLEARIRNQRERLAQEEEAVARLKAERAALETPAAPTVLLPIALVPPVAGEAAFPGKPDAAFLERVAGGLADQRAHLLEQWQTLLRVQHEWRCERETALAGLEAAGRSLQEREDQVLAHERDLDAAAADCRQRQQALSQMRYSLEGWQARVKARDASWEAERAALLAETRAREEAAGLQLQRLQELGRRRQLQRAREAEELAVARKRCEDLRQQYAALLEEWQRRRTELASEQRDLAARALAVEQLRLEVVGASPQSAKAEGRLERLRRRNLGRIEAAEREIEEARASLTDENARLDELVGQLLQQQEELAAQREELARDQAAWEERRAAAADADERGRLEMQKLLARRQQDERLIAQLREEVERTVHLLMDEPDDEARTAQAA